MAMTVRIDPDDSDKLDQLAGEMGMPKTRVLGEAIELLRRHFILQATHAGYSQLRQDKTAWAQELKERAAWDAACVSSVDSDERQ